MHIYSKYSDQQGLLGMPQGSLEGASEHSLVQVEIVGSEIACAFFAYHVPHTGVVLHSVISIEHTRNTLKIAS